MQSSNIKETWKILNGIIKKHKTHSESEYPDTFIHENKSVNSKMDISNGFNKFFVNIGPNLEKKYTKYCKYTLLTTNLAAVVWMCVSVQNLTNFCPHALISNPNVPKILFA